MPKAFRGRRHLSIAVFWTSRFRLDLDKAAASCRDVDPGSEQIWSGVQYPHCKPSWRTKAACIGWRSSPFAKPSMVVILSPECITTSVRHDVLRSATARARLDRDDRLVVELAMTDIGTGTYTILTQIAAEATEMPIARVTVLMGDTNYPPTDGSGGSFGAATSGAAVLAACGKLKAGRATARCR
jgi:hypothetical protein